MSYDLLVFDPSVAPRLRDDFVAWWHNQAEWSEPHTYDDPDVTSNELKSWFEGMQREWPCINGPRFREEEIDNPRLTDYCIGKQVIYASFAWPEAENAYPVVREMAVIHQVGFYDVSGDEGDGEIYFPGDRLRPPSEGEWRRVAAGFRSGEME